MESALRTIETERNGLDVLREAMDGELGRAFVAVREENSLDHLAAMGINALDFLNRTREALS